MLENLNKNKYTILSLILLIVSFTISKYTPFNFSDKLAAIISLTLLALSIILYVVNLKVKKDKQEINISKFFAVIVLLLAVIIFVILQFVK